MTARIARSFDLQMGVHFTGAFYMNLYDIDLQFNVETESIKEQNIALERIKFYLSECLEQSILIHDKEEDAIEKYMAANLRICIIPEEPYDQIIGILLLTKLNAITEGKLVITDINIGSRMSDGVTCLHSLEDNPGPFLLKGWWNDNNTKINDYKYSPRNKKIVKLLKPVEWSEIYLDYTSSDDQSLGDQIITNDIANDIVYINFDNNKQGK